MTLLVSRPHKRNIALTMLFVWLFALLSGIANACLTEPRGEPALADKHASTVDQSALRAEAPGGSEQVHHGEHADHGEDPDKSSCHKSCDASSQTLLKQLPKLDRPDLQAVVQAFYEQPAGQHLALRALACTPLAAVPPPLPPPRLQFSRLAL